MGTIDTSTVRAQLDFSKKDWQKCPESFSLFVVAIAALNLILDFDMIEKGAELGAPKYMEWYGAFGLLVTIVWLYLEILRLLSKISSRN